MRSITIRFLITVLAVALLVAIVALLHELRLRRAFQQLCRRLLERWRNRDGS